MEESSRYCSEKKEELKQHVSTKFTGLNVRERRQERSERERDQEEERNMMPAARGGVGGSGEGGRKQFKRQHKLHPALHNGKCSISSPSV